MYFHFLFVIKLSQDVFVFLFQSFFLANVSFFLILSTLIDFHHEVRIFSCIFVSELIFLVLGPFCDCFLPLNFYFFVLNNQMRTIYFFSLLIFESSCIFPCRMSKSYFFSRKMISLLLWRRD